MKIIQKLRLYKNICKYLSSHEDYDRDYANMFLIWLKCISSIWVLEKGKWKNSQLSASAKSNQISKKAGGKIEQKHTNIPKNTNILLLV